MAAESEIEADVFGGDLEVSQRVYHLLREVLEFQRACEPLADVLGYLVAGFVKYDVDVELQRRLRDVQITPRVLWNG